LGARETRAVSGLLFSGGHRLRGDFYVAQNPFLVLVAPHLAGDGVAFFHATERLGVDKKHHRHCAHDARDLLVLHEQGGLVGHHFDHDALQWMKLRRRLFGGAVSGVVLRVQRDRGCQEGKSDKGETEFHMGRGSHFSVTSKVASCVGRLSMV
jgi:hypothetical protein